MPSRERLVEFTVGDAVDRLRALRPTHRRNPGAAPIGERPIFFLSTGRVGTQTFARLFARSPHVRAVHEPKPNLFALSRLGFEASEADAVLLEAVRVARGDRIAAAARSGQRWFETSPQSTFLAPAIAAAFPGAQFVHVVRDVPALIASGGRRGWYEGHHRDPSRLVPTSSSDWHERWPGWSQAERIAWLWLATNRWLVHRAVADDAIRLRAEDLFASPQSTCERLAGFLHIDAPRAGHVDKTMAKRLNRSAGTDPADAAPSQTLDGDLVEAIDSLRAELGYRSPW